MPDNFVNGIRAELTTVTGVDYGQRGAYTGVWWWDDNGRNGIKYQPIGSLTKEQYAQMNQASIQKNASLLPNVPFIVIPLADNKYMISK